MTDPLAYGEGLGGSVIILATFLGVVGLVQVAAYVRDRLQARKRRRQSQTTVGRLAGMTKIGGRS